MPFVKSFLNAHPVGCVYTSAVSTSPAILFGGTWTAIEGVFIVAKAASGTFSTAGATGGVENVTLTAAQSGLPAHNHTLNLCSWGGDTASFASAANNSTIQRYGATATTNDVNASASHTNLPPYKVYYQWERTA